MLHPLMLLGLLGLSVPTIIHLIQKQRLKPQLLATLQFLDREDVANVFAPVPRDVLQLILRLLLLTVFILLMARLVTGTASPGPKTLAVIVDQSMSMDTRVGDAQSLFLRHQSRITELIRGLQPGDKMSLVLVGDRITLETGFLEEKDELQRIAGGMKGSASGALALMPAIRGAVHRLRSRREVNAFVLVFSDHQRVNYLSDLEEARPEGRDAPAAAFRQALNASHVKVCLIDECPRDTANLSIEQASFRPERVTIGSGSRLSATVRNWTGEEKATSLTLYEGDKAGEQRSLTLKAGETATIDLVHRFESPIDTACRVQMEEDVLPADDTFHVPMRMKERQQLLLVAPHTEREDDTAMELSYRGVELLAYAMNPGEALGQGAGTSVQVKRVTPSLLERVSLPLYSVVVFCGVNELPKPSERDLLTFLRNGGGLYVIPDREVSPRLFNEVYGPLLNGMVVGQLRQPEEAQRLDRNEGRLARPLLAPLLRGEWGDPDDMVFSEYFGIEQAGTSEILLRAANGDALAVGIPQERGYLFLQLFSADLESSSLPRCTAFVPFIQETIGAIGQPEDPTRPETIRVGEILHLRVPEFRNLGGKLTVAGPETREFAMAGPRSEEVRVDGLLQAGAYEVSHPAKVTGRKRWLTVNPVSGESDLSPLSPDDQAALFGDRNVVRLPFSELEGQFTRRHEIVGWMAALLALAFAAEALLGAWQSRRSARREETEGPDA